MRSSSFLIGLIAFSWAGSSAATEIEEGGVYRGPKRLELPLAGVSFQLPGGYAGKANAEGMAIGHFEKPGMIVATMRPNVSLDEIKAELAAPIALDDQHVLRQKGKARVKGEWITAEFGGQGIAGFAAVRRHASGRAIAFIGATTTNKNLKWIRSAVRVLAKSVKFSKSRQNSFWKKKLSNKQYNYYNTGSTHTTKRIVVLCANGRYQYRSSSSGSTTSDIVDGPSVTASYAGNSGSAGTWKVGGGKAQGRLLMIEDGDAEPSQHDLRMKDGSLYVDGSRWLHDSRVAVNCAVK